MCTCVCVCVCVFVCVLWMSCAVVVLLLSWSGPRGDLTNCPALTQVVRGGVLYVKRKTGYLLYERDPQGDRAIFSRRFPKPANVNAPSLQVCIRFRWACSLVAGLVWIVWSLCVPPGAVVWIQRK